MLLPVSTKLRWLHCLALACLLAPRPGSAAESAAPDPLSSQTNAQLLATLQAGMPKSKGFYPDDLTEAAAEAKTPTQLVVFERALLELKRAVATDPKLAAVDEELIARYAALEQQEAENRKRQIEAVVKDLTDKFNAKAPMADYDGILKRINALAEEQFPNGLDQVEERRLNSASQFISNWQDYLAAIERGDTQAARTAVYQLTNLATSFTAIPRSRIVELQNAPSEALASRDRSSQSEADRLIARVTAGIDAAKVPADLDALINELAAQPISYNESNMPNFNSQRMGGMRAFVRRWQDYLNAVQTGNAVEAQRILSELASPTYDSGFYPRSRILAHLTDRARALGGQSKDGLLIPASALTLDNLQALRQQLETLSTTDTDGHRTMLRFAVGHLADAWSQTKAGDFRAGLSAVRYGTPPMDDIGDYSGALTRLSAEIATAAVPGFVGAPPDLAPKPGEKLPDYMDRLMAGALAANDWKLAFRVAEARKEVGTLAGDTEQETADFQGFRSLVVAQEKEEASQWADSVSSYLDALSSAGLHLPTKAIGARLQAIERDHPAEYEKGKAEPDYASLVTRMMEKQRVLGSDARFTRPPAGNPGLPNQNYNLIPGQPPGNGIPANRPTPIGSWVSPSAPNN